MLYRSKYLKIFSLLWSVFSLQFGNTRGTTVEKFAFDADFLLFTVFVVVLNCRTCL